MRFQFGEIGAEGLEQSFATGIDRQQESDEHQMLASINPIKRWFALLVSSGRNVGAPGHSDVS